MKRVVISSFITLVILGLAALAYFYFQQYSIVTDNPVNAIPSNTFFFIETKSAKSSLNKLSSLNLLSSVTNTDSSTVKNIKLLDAALSSNDEVKSIWENKPVYLSAHLTKANNFDYLYLANVPSSWTDEKTEHFILKAFHIETPADKRVYESTAVHEITISADKKFSFAVIKGIFIGSFTSFLIDDAIRQVKTGTPVNKSKAFVKLDQFPGEKNEGSIYINYISLHEFFSAFSSNGNSNVFNAIGSFARWSKLDATFQNNNFTFHGSTTSTDTSDFITSMRGQQPQKIDVSDILPSRTAMFVHFGLSNFTTYYHHLLSNSVFYDPPNKRSQMIKSLEKKFSVHPEKNLTEWVGNEIAFIITEPGSTSFNNNCYACIKAQNTETAFADLQQLQNSINKKDKDPSASFSGEYRKHPVGFINLSGLVPLFYSNFFSLINKFYYTTAGNYIVIANQASSLRSFIDDYEDNKSLSSDPLYKSVSGNAERQTNFFCYMNLERCKNIFRSYASVELNDMMSNNGVLLNRFSAFTYQLVNQNEIYETTIQLVREKEKINDVNQLWSAQLDTVAATIPCLLTDAETKKNFIAVQDENKNLYLLDDAGSVVWKKAIPEKIISRFYVVDAYKSGQQQILFNTASQLYLLDLNGNDYGNYPIKLPATATNGCAVFDFDQSKNYKVLAACSNRMIYAYEISGKPMSGWLFYQPVSNITKPLQNFSSEGKDYVLAYNNNGTIFLLDRKGSVRVSLRQTVVASNSTFSLATGDSLDADHLVTTDSTGKIISIYFNGTVRIKSAGAFSPEHTFTFADADGDGKPDYIFLDHHQLKVIRTDGSEIYSRVFSETILPVIYTFNFTSSLQLAIGSEKENKFFLMNKDGRISNGFPVKGFSGISSNNWGPEGKSVLITTGTDGAVYLYNLE